MIDALSRIKGLVEVKKNAINLGVNLGQLPNNEVMEIPELLTIEHNISERITKMMWQSNVVKIHLMIYAISIMQRMGKPNGKHGKIHVQPCFA